MIGRWLGPWHEYGYAALRIVAAVLYLLHGTKKLVGFPAGPHTGDPLLVVAALIEIVTGILVAAGLFTREAAFLASGEMAVAYFTVHAPRSFWPIVSRGELPVLFCFIFLYVACRGAGPLSVDARFRRVDS